ncbi:MAG: hypothetical protein ABIB04_02285 [Patescibacteria group bacterium]
MTIAIPKQADQKGLEQLRVVIHEIERIWREAGFEGAPLSVYEHDSEYVALSFALFKDMKKCRAQFYFRHDGSVNFFNFRSGSLRRIKLSTWNEGVASVIESLNYYLVLKISNCRKCKEMLTDLIGETPTSQRPAVTPEMAEEILGTASSESAGR